MLLKKPTNTVLLILILLLGGRVAAQPHWFIDGYHGGAWGHYPRGYTSFIVDQLQKHPNWKINLEIEPVTWDLAKQNDSIAYQAIQDLLRDTSIGRRIEYVNPSYGQSYLYNISGESIIRQFAYGIKKLRQHFPLLHFETYSSEEPCFTSALPQILNSFGFKYASLKNPNTCWGGYTKANGGELVRWIGPDGSWLYTVPRYASETLVTNTPWQSTAWNNSAEYIQAALQAGVQHPIGMCLQDAGWRNGPWMGKNVRYTTWQHYFKEVADTQLATNWKFSQEDVLVSLVWGGQVLQRIAQQVRHAENRLIATEKLAAMAALQGLAKWPQAAFDEAWENLLLAQHHDCWIVPYNGRKGDRWIEKVQRWTGSAERICDSITNALGEPVSIVNTTAIDRNEQVEINGRLINVKVPAVSAVPFPVNSNLTGSTVTQRAGVTTIETDLYKIVIDSCIRSLVSNNKEWVKDKKFNYLPGVASDSVTIIEKGPMRIKVRMSGNYKGHPVHQIITLVQGQARIDCSIHIDWQHNIPIGNNYAHKSNRDYKKAFYNDRDKLLLLFPVKLSNQKIYKNAPFDVTTSKLNNTFFTTWDSIKNNIVLNWVDVSDGKHGMAIFTDHTTAYVHHPLGLVVQYSGAGLFDMNYTLDGPTTINYSLLPHTGKWDEAGLEAERVKLAEPLQVSAIKPTSILQFSKPGWELSAMTIDGNDLLVRIYNAAAADTTVNLQIPFKNAILEELDGSKRSVFNGTITAPLFGFRTIRFHDVIKN